MKRRLYTIIVFLLVLTTALALSSCGGSTSLKSDLDDTVEKEIHGLAYQIPTNWDESSDAHVNDYKEFQGYVRRDENDKFLSQIEVYYLGDDTDIVTMEGEGITLIDDSERTISVGEDTLYAYSYKFDYDDGTATDVCSTSFAKDYSSFLITMESVNDDPEFFDEFVQRVRLADYSNPRKAVGLSAKYTGERIPGNYIGTNDKNVEVEVEFDNGDKEKANNWELEDSLKIEAGKTSEGTIHCHGLTCKLEVKGEEPTEIKAKYLGATVAGTRIVKDSFDVTAVYGDEKVSVDDFELSEEKTLKADESVTVTISYAGLTKKIEIICTTVSAEKENALKMAESYLRSGAFSKTGLIKQLEFEGFTNDEAKYAADNCGADWKEQAVKSAESYLRSSAFSKSGLYDQLKFEGFTDEQASYGVEQAYQ